MVGHSSGEPLSRCVLRGGRIPGLSPEAKGRGPKRGGGNVILSSMNCLLLLSILAAGADSPRILDVTDAVGLGSGAVPESVSRLCFADLDDDGRPDVVIDRHLVFLHRSDAAAPRGWKYVPVAECGLRVPDRGTVTVFADVDGDGTLDAIVGENFDARKEGWTDHGRRTAWQKGNGDGTFGEVLVIDGVSPATTCAIGVGDVDLDGQLDLWLANWYLEYGASVAAYPNELVTRDDDRWCVTALPLYADEELEEATDLDGRPTYGVMIARLGGGVRPDLLEMNYGRRWDRVWRWSDQWWGGWRDIAPRIGTDADDIRHGKYPDWAIERMAQREPPIELEPELPFRSNGNSFCCSVGDIDNDGDFDLFFAAITHGWAGEASDRSRFWVNRLAESGELRFEYEPHRCVDRVPEGVNNWNQGDLFCALADFDCDTRLDLILCSGDYPDDQRLRIFIQQPDGSFVDRGAEFGLDHDGAHQVSLADVDADADLDLLVGQTFFRYSAEMKEGRSPLPRLFLNETNEGRRSLTLRLEGDETRANRDALGTIVKAQLADGTTMQRQLVGIGGHAGRQDDFLIHFGLGEHDAVTKLEVIWPDAGQTTQSFDGVAAGRYRLKMDGELNLLTGE